LKQKRELYSIKSRNTESCGQSPEARRGHGTDSVSEFLEGFISFIPSSPELEKNNFL
jgi:hypothetical protein